MSTKMDEDDWAHTLAVFRACLPRRGRKADDDRRFQAIARRLPEGVEPIRLYESYLTNFSFANGE